MFEATNATVGLEFDFFDNFQGESIWKVYVLVRNENFSSPI